MAFSKEKWDQMVTEVSGRTNLFGKPFSGSKELREALEKLLKFPLEDEDITLIAEIIKLAGQIEVSAEANRNYEIDMGHDL